MGGRGRLIKVEGEEICVLSRMSLHKMQFQCQKLDIGAKGFFFVLKDRIVFSGQRLY